MRKIGVREEIKSGITDVIKEFNYKVPAYANRLPYMLGGLAFVCIIVLALSGMYMVLFYVPTPQLAYSSIYNFITKVPFGDFIRSIHFWTAQIVILILVLHIGRVIVSGSYKGKRLAQYLTGVLLLAVMLIIEFAGEILALDQQAVDGFIRIQEIAAFFGINNLQLSSIIGPLLVSHISILIVILIAILVVHLTLVDRHGFSPDPKKLNDKTRITTGEGNSDIFMHFRRLAGFGCILIAIIATLAVVSPAPLGYPGVYDPTVMIARPDLSIFYPADIEQTLFGNIGMLIGPAALFIALILLPFLDRSPYIHWRRRKWVIFYAIAILAVGVAFGALDAVGPLVGPANAGYGGAVTLGGQTAGGPSVFGNPPLYFVSNGSKATLYGIWSTNRPMPDPMLSAGEFPVIIGGIVIFLSAGVIILRKSRLPQSN